MKPFVVKPISRLNKKILLSGDKSIAHRAVMISALSTGRARILNFPVNKDCSTTLRIFRQLGIKIAQKCCVNRQGVRHLEVTVFGKGLNGLRQPSHALSLEESGTTLRLLLGVLAGQNLTVKLVADTSLSLRPMRRVNAPLRLMGALICSKTKFHTPKKEEYLPIIIRGGNLTGITYRMPVASAQVKSALLLAGLKAKGRTAIVEPIPTRDHTERMLKCFGASIKHAGNTIVIEGGKPLVTPKEIYVPGDISSAAFFLVLGVIIPHSKLLIRKVCLNPSRIGIIHVLERMGARIVVRQRYADSQFKNETMGDIEVRSSVLRPARVKEKEIPSLIDELPILMVAACFANGRSVFEGAQELRVKETDRITSMSSNLKQMGAKISIVSHGTKTNVVINGPVFLKGARVRSFGDHRTAMSMIVAGLAAKGETRIDDASCIDKSFPDFLRLLSFVIQ